MEVLALKYILSNISECPDYFEVYNSSRQPSIQRIIRHTSRLPSADHLRRKKRHSSRVWVRVSLEKEANGFELRSIDQHQAPTLLILSFCTRTLCIQAASLHPALCYPSSDCTFKIYERHFRPGHNFPRFSGMIANAHVSNLPRDTRIGFVNKSSISTAVNRTRFGGFAYSFQGMPLVWFPKS